jgi:hypothetical protein
MREWGYRVNVIVLILGLALLNRGVGSGNAPMLGVGSSLVLLSIGSALCLRYRRIFADRGTLPREDRKA